MHTQSIAIFKYLAPTNHRGARVKIQVPEKTVIMPFNYEHNTALAQAIQWLKDEGYQPHQVIGEHKGETLISCNG